MKKQETIFDIIEQGEKRLAQLERELAEKRQAFLKASKGKDKNLHSGINSIIDNYLAEKHLQEG
jgi:hypothetical protein